MIVDHITAAAAIGGTANDADPHFRRVVFAANQSVCSDCHRTFERLGLDGLGARILRTEIPRAFGGPALWLREDPVRSISEIRLDFYGAFGDDTIIDSSVVLLDPGGFERSATIRRLDGGVFPEGANTVQVLYDGGYDPRDETQVPTGLEMPEEIRDLVIRRIARRLARGLGEVMKSESMGSYSYTRADEMDHEEKLLIRKYRR